MAQIAQGYTVYADHGLAFLSGLGFPICFATANIMALSKKHVRFRVVVLVAGRNAQFLRLAYLSINLPCVPPGLLMEFWQRSFIMIGKTNGLRRCLGSSGWP